MLASFSLLSMLAGSASPVAAQDAYVTAGWLQVWRQPPWQLSFEIPVRPPAAAVPAVTAGGGIWLTRHTAVEGTLSVYRAQEVPWKWRYLFGGTASDQVATDRDVPLSGTIRLAPWRGRHLAIEPVISGGVTFHGSRSYIIATCGPTSRPTACVPVEPRTESDAVTTAEWMLGAGADVPIRVSSRLDVLPGVRFMFARRRPYLTGYDHRGPGTGGGALPGFGVSARVRLTRTSTASKYP